MERLLQIIKEVKLNLRHHFIFDEEVVFNVQTLRLSHMRFDLYNIYEGYCISLLSNGITLTSELITYYESNLITEALHGKVNNILIRFSESQDINTFYDGSILLYIYDHNTAINFICVLVPHISNINWDLITFLEKYPETKNTYKIEAELCRLNYPDDIFTDINDMDLGYTNNKEKISKIFENSPLLDSLNAYKKNMSDFYQILKMTQKLKFNKHASTIAVKSSNTIVEKPIMQEIDNELKLSLPKFLSPSSYLNHAPVSKYSNEVPIIKSDQYTFKLPDMSKVMRLVIWLKPSESKYFGNLQDITNETNAKCFDTSPLSRFYLGNLIHVTKYIQQFINLLSNDGHKKIIIEHVAKGKKTGIYSTLPAPIGTSNQSITIIEEKSDRKIEKNKKTKSLTPTIKDKTIVEIDTDVDLSRVSKTRTILPKIIDSFKDVYHSSHYYNTNQNHIQNPNTNFTSNKASFSPICIENDVEEYNENLPTPLKFRKYQ